MDNRNKKKDEKILDNPSNSYKFKYAHIIGSDSAVAAAKITTPNQQFGMGMDLNLFLYLIII